MRRQGRRRGEGHGGAWGHNVGWGGGNGGLRPDGCAVTSNYRGWRKKEGVA